MWSIDGVDIQIRANGQLLINVKSKEKRSLLLNLFRRILSPGDYIELTDQIVLEKGKYLCTAGSNRIDQVYVPYSRGKSFYGLYIDHDDGNLVLMLMGDSSNIGQQGEIEILDSLEKLGS